MMTLVVECEERSKQYYPTQGQGQAIRALITKCETSSSTSARSSLNIQRAPKPSDLTRKG